MIFGMLLEVGVDHRIDDRRRFFRILGRQRDPDQEGILRDLDQHLLAKEGLRILGFRDHRVAGDALGFDADAGRAMATSSTVSLVISWTWVSR